MQWKLIQLRKERGLSQKDVADVIGIDVRSYIPREHGTVPFRADEMFKLRDYFDVAIEDIFLPRNSTNSGMESERHGI